MKEKALLSLVKVDFQKKKMPYEEAKVLLKVLSPGGKKKIFFGSHDDLHHFFRIILFILQQE